MIASLVSEWYALNPDIRRVWAYEAGEAIDVVVALRPACDSDDISPIWLGKCARWQRQLEEFLGQSVRLDWLDGDTEAAPCADHARVCLANIAWRDCCSEEAGDAANDTKVSLIPSSNRPDGAFSGVMRTAPFSPHKDHL